MLARQGAIRCSNFNGMEKIHRAGRKKGKGTQQVCQLERKMGEDSNMKMGIDWTEEDEEKEEDSLSISAGQ